MEHELKKMLTRAGLRLTTARMTVFAALRDAKTPLSIVEVTSNCPSIDKASVYRTIAVFLRHDIVVSVPQGWKQRYELAVPFRPHHHHIVCTACGSAIEIHSEALELLVADMTQQYAFLPMQHHFEIHGLCKTCRHTEAG